MNVPRDAREVYVNKDGEPIAFCPKESIGLTDLRRAQFFTANKERLAQLEERAAEKGPDFAVVCIDVDDPTWTDLVEQLMPGQDWSAIRATGAAPVARGIVTREPIVTLVEALYPAAGDPPEGAFTVVFAAGGATFFSARDQ